MSKSPTERLDRTAMERNNSRLLIALGGALGCSLLVIAFLVGRVTARPAETVRVVEPTPVGVLPAHTVIPTASVLEPTAAVLAVQEDDRTPPGSAGWTPPTTLDAKSAPAPSLTALNPPRPADRQAISSYFAQVERMDDVGAGDPQTFASSMLQSVSSGDFSGFDDLLAKSREHQERLRRITVPQVCAEHHRLAVSLSADSVAMLERLKASLIRGDSTALITIAAEGRTLEEQANRLKGMGEALKRQAGL